MLKQWLNNRKIKLQEDAYERGFNWVMGSYFIGLYRLDVIEAKLGWNFNSSDVERSFDKGAIFAIGIINKEIEIN